MRYYSSKATPKTLSAEIPNGTATTMIVNDVAGLPVTFDYTLVIDPDLATEEIVTVTGASGTTLTISRGQDGTSGISHTAGSTVKHMITARDLQEPQNHIIATTAHGATGAVVGTTNTQTLTNKTISGSANTLSNIPQSAVTSLTTDLAAKAASVHTHAQSDVTNLTSDLALKAPLAGPTFTGTVVLPSTTSIGNVTATEIGYVDGVTSAIQTQIDSKAPINNANLTGTVVLPSTTSIGTVSSTEIGYIDGVTSAVQTQLNNLIGGSAGRACMVYANTTVTTMSVANTWYAVQFDTEVLDTVGWWTSGNSTRLTPTVAGYYLVMGSVYGLAAAAGVSRYGAVRKNGSTFVAGSTNRFTEPTGTFQGAALTIQTNPVIVYMNGSTDYLELMARSDQSTQEASAANTDGQASALTLLKVA